MEGVFREGRSLEETPTWSVATVTTVMVFVCLFVERSIYRCGRWLKKTRRKALFASVEKIKEELMLLGLISLLLGQCARQISQICVNSSLFSSKFYLCSQEDYGSASETIHLSRSSILSNDTDIPPKGIYQPSHQCGEGREPFVSYEGLEQLHRFLFVLGITHILYSCIVVGLAMTKIYSWRKWENQVNSVAENNLQVLKNKEMRRQSTFALHHASHPWSRSRILIWMLCFIRQFRTSIRKADYLALRLGFITNHKLPLTYNFHNYMVRSMEDEFYEIVGISWLLWGYAIICIFINIHGLNIYFWLSFIPGILVMVVGTKLQHVVSSLALEIAEPKGPLIGTQVKPRDELFWFGKPKILLRLIQFISFQNAFEMATFIWSLWGMKQRSCFMKNHAMVVIRLISGVLVQFWCSHSTVPLNVIISQMGSRCGKALVAESVQDSLHSWCRRVKNRSKQDALRSIATRSTCSLESMIDEGDEIATVASVTLSPCSSRGSFHHLDENVLSNDQQEDCIGGTSNQPGHELSFRNREYSCEALEIMDDEKHSSEPLDDMDNDDADKTETLFELFQKT
ncbi:MLO-like protein 4 [Capsicum annuum]|uniref:MLO-like protein n=1 Tax=Capsicum annuum TaxID=4072 RepID=A0A2G2YKS7_CAPAN|nr:MLO-like protein 4 isoform X3 [Capsicum annuum]KAF3659434.1 MLO-like protein 4 [Capsicum annuum]PHT70362.1 MLO-like protein 4 [Capsicum annuum]